MKRFDALSAEWLEFIKENRSKGGLQYLQLVRRGAYARNDI